MIGLADRVSAWLVSRHDVSEDQDLLGAMVESVRARGDLQGQGYFSSLSGGACYLFNPHGSHITLQDIAVTLGRVARWGGRTHAHLPPYSVAQHAVMVSYLCRPENALTGLHHDDTEAYLGDIISPLKRQLPAYKAIEQSWADAIGVKLGVPELRNLPADVHIADLIALELERHDLMARGDAWHHWGMADRPTLLPTIEPLAPEEATALWLSRHHELTSQRNTP